MNDIVVYVVNADLNIDSNINYLTIEDDNKEVIRELIEIAEKHDSVYSLKEFELAINDESLWLDNSWIYFANKNVKI